MLAFFCITGVALILLGIMAIFFWEAKPPPTYDTDSAPPMPSMRQPARTSNKLASAKPIAPAAPRAPIAPAAPRAPTAPNAPLPPRAPTAPIAPLPPRAPTAPIAPLPPRAPTASITFRWIPKDEEITVAGFRLAGGLVYVGTGLPALAAYRDIEPALIDPRLPVRAGPASESGEGMGYWPVYANISPEHRAGYLQWLAGGRSNPTAYIGYVFLFFYGLERRALHTDKASVPDPGDLASIVAEVERLVGVYGINGSFAGYAGGFLNLCRFRAGEGDGPLRSGLFGWEIPADVRLRLGRRAADKTPVPADVAFAWACNLPSAPSRTPATRCEAEFRELFALRYEHAHGAGVTLKNQGAALTITYRPASPGFGGSIELKIRDVRDVTKSNEALGAALVLLAGKCVDELDPYSRWLGRNAGGEAPALAGVALLPQELLQRHGAPALADLRQWLDQYVPHEQALVTGASEVLVRWQPDGGPKVSKGDATALLQFLQKLGYGMEPDVRFGGPSPLPTGQIALFRLKGEFSAPSAEYTGVTTLLRFAATVAGADGVAESEARFLTDHVSTGLGLGAPERLRLAAHVAWLLSDPPGVGGLKKAAESLTPAQRADIGRFLVSVAGADGTVSRAEVQMLLKVFVMLGLPEEAVYSQVHHLGGPAPGARVVPAEPVVVRPAGAPDQGFAIPPRTPAAGASVARTPASEGIRLDMALVHAQLAESARVSAVLADIFRGDEDAPPPAPVVTTELVAGFDGAHSILFARLRDLEVLERAEWDAWCAEAGLMPNGAIDCLNEAAFDRVGDPLLSGDDPIHLDAEVYRSLQA